MTSVFGLRHQDVEMAVLAADRQSSYGPGQVPVYKILERKLWIADDGLYAFGHSGLRDDKLAKLAKKLVEGKDIDVEKVVTEGKFPQLRELTHERMGDTVPSEDSLSSFLLVTRFNNDPKLYTCWPLGRVEPRTVTYIGSGSPRLEEYINSLSVLSEARRYLSSGASMDSDDVIRVAIEGLGYAQGKDVFSSGLDLVVVTPDRITDHFKDLQDDLGKRIKRVQKQHRKAKK
ncbi:MAG: hypothetical protein ABIF88_00900 [archaeon]